MNVPEPAGIHVDEGEVLAWIDGEMAPTKAERFRAHLEHCARCVALRSELEEAAALFSRALGQVDVATPARSASPPRVRAPRWRVLRPLPAAALLVLVFATGVLALVPGSPLRSWIASLRHGSSVSEPAGRLVGRTLVTQLSVAAPEQVDVVLAEPEDSLRLELVRSSGSRLVVETSRAGSLGRVELGADRLRIEPGAARFLRIAFPRRAHVRVLFRGQDLLSGRAGMGAVPATRDSVTRLRLGPSGGG
jgi:Putative zinc-finger